MLTRAASVLPLLGNDPWPRAMTALNTASEIAYSQIWCSGCGGRRKERPSMLASSVWLTLWLGECLAGAAASLPFVRWHV
jgi:hypothetical protein